MSKEATDAAQAFNQANAQYRQKQYEAAAGLYRQAAQGFAAAPQGMAYAGQAHLGWARCEVALGQHALALQGFAAALHANASDYSAWLEQAHCLRVEGQMEASLHSYQQAMALQPTRFEAPLGLVRTLESLDRRSEAAQVIASAVAQLQAQQAHTHLLTFYQRLGRYRMELGHLPSAFDFLRLAHQLCPHLSDADEREEMLNTLRLDMAEILLRDHQADQAHALLTEISRSNNTDMLRRLADLSYRFNLHGEAVEVLHKRVGLMPHSPEAWLALASTQAECWLLTEAEAALQRAEALNAQATTAQATTAPSTADAPPASAEHTALAISELRGRIASKLGDAQTAFELRQAWLDQQKPGPHLAVHHSAQAMTSLYCDFFAAQDIAHMHRSSFAHLGQGARTVDSFDAAWLAQAGVSRKIRLGIVSADFHHQHPVNLFMQPVLRELDRSRFEVVMYYSGAAYDAETTKARGRVDQWVEATYLSDKHLAARIVQDRIDVLLDLSGHTGHNRMRMFAQRAAPVQVTHLGYPGSTGVPNMDWILGDHRVTPAQHQALYSERLAPLDGNVFCYAPEIDYPYPHYGAAHAQRPLTMGSFNNLTKMNPRTLGLWLRIHRALPESRLLLKAPSFAMPSAQAYYRQKLAGLGFDVQRVELQGPVGLTDMMAQYEQLDIALDPLPYNGGTTTLQAMWMGVPVVCQEGPYFVSRMSSSFMGRLGLQDWVSHSDDEYVQIAVNQGKDRLGLLALKQRLRALQQAHPAWNPVLHTRSFERCIEAMLKASR